MNLKFRGLISFLNELRANWSKTNVAMAIAGDRVLGSTVYTEPQVGRQAVGWVERSGTQLTRLEVVLGLAQVSLGK